MKYENYRERFLRYFVFVPDSTDLKIWPWEAGGYCLPADVRSFDGYNTAVRWADTEVNLGTYWAVLATEARLYQQNNKAKQCAATLHELNLALDAYYRLDEKAEQYFGEPKGEINGFFIRDDVSYLSGENGQPNYFTQHFLPDTALSLTKSSGIFIVSDCGHCGHPPCVYLDEQNPSQNPHCGQAPSYCFYTSLDQTIHLLHGLAIIKACLPNETQIRHKTKQIAQALRQYWLNACPAEGCGILNHGPAYNPVTGQQCQHWGNFYGFGYAIVKAADFIVGDTTRNIPCQGQCGWQLTNNRLCLSTYNCHMKTAIAAASGISPQINNRNPKAFVKFAFARNWPVYALSYWLVHGEQNEKNHKKAFSTKQINEIKQLLNTAPAQGPFNFMETQNNTMQYYLSPSIDTDEIGPNGWAAPSRWGSSKAHQFGQIPPKVPGQYNGLDYMLLYNLTNLVLPQSFED
ncbi:MAG: hypothetical protein IT272_04675 [Chitinophagales bacterium]|nr:hypothetical protein [Sphingobacteriales bacterium]MBP9140580.1 hypothetical protein [Chitinophagales bacterium]MDA0197370.1 hypothetical protein [Bacteroidota bacterium]MBK6888680.1 hypothetical protein [Sphingobacteriales bacterium]MBL0246918.1 hypothetical protein [Sphingobacteriales bacterium]